MNMYTLLYLKWINNKDLLYGTWDSVQWSVAARMGDPGFNPWVEKIPWRRKWQPTLVFLPGKSHGQRTLVGYRTWSRKESDMTEQLHFLSLFNKN